MNYPVSKGIRVGTWDANEMLQDLDINFIGDAQYTNFVSAMVPLAGGLTNTVDSVITGLEVEADTLMTLTLKAGIALSATGSYLIDSVWGFTATAGELFGVVVPVDTSVSILTAHATLPRIDIIQIRPVRTEYDEQSRQYKDPITGLVASSPTDTKVEYGFEFDVVAGTAASSPSAPLKTAGWIKVAEVYVEAAATTIGAEKIGTIVGTHQWDENNDETVSNAVVQSDISITVPATSASKPLDIERLISSVPKDLNGHTLTITFATASYDAGAWSFYFFYFRDGTIKVKGTGITIGDPDTSITADLLVSGLNFRYLRNVSVEVELLKLTQCTFSFVDCPNCSLDFTDTTVFDPYNDAIDGSFIDIQNVASVDFGLLEIHATGTNTPPYAMYLQNIPYVTSLPVFDATAIAKCDYFARFANVVIQDSSNLVLGTVGDIDPASSKYTLLDRVITALTQDITINVSTSDSTATMQGLIDAIPKDLGGYTLTFQFADGTYNWTSSSDAVVFSGFHNGEIDILGNSSDTTVVSTKSVSIVMTQLNGSAAPITVIGCSCNTTIAYIAINVTQTIVSSFPCILIRRSTYALVSSMALKGAATTDGVGLTCDSGATVQVNGVHFSLCDSATYINGGLLYMPNSSSIFLTNTTDLKCVQGSIYGSYSFAGLTESKSGGVIADTVSVR